MSKYSDKKLAKQMGTYVPPYDRSDGTVRAAIRANIVANEVRSPVRADWEDELSRFNSQRDRSLRM